MLLTIKFSAAPANIDIINSEALPITYSVCCVFVALADSLQPITLCYYLLYSAKGSLSHGRQHMDSNAGLEANCITLRLPPRPLGCLDQAQLNLYGPVISDLNFGASNFRYNFLTASVPLWIVCDTHQGKQSTDALTKQELNVIHAIC